MRSEQHRTTRYCTFTSALGEVLATSDGRALTGVYLERQKDYPAIGGDWIEDAAAAPFPALRAQWREYESGARREFDLPMHLEGTPFQTRVWSELRRIECGRTISYAELAARAGAPKAVRAVGTAVGRNPISVLVPCHRVIASDGSLAGYAGGLDRKRALLELEGALETAG